MFISQVRSAAGLRPVRAPNFCHTPPLTPPPFPQLPGLIWDSFGTYFGLGFSSRPFTQLQLSPILTFQTLLPMFFRCPPSSIRHPPSAILHLPFSSASPGHHWDLFGTPLGPPLSTLKSRNYRPIPRLHPNPSSRLFSTFI